MMEKSKWYDRTRFSPEVIAEAHKLFCSVTDLKDNSSRPGDLRVSDGSETWTFDSLDEFYAACRNAYTFEFSLSTREGRLQVGLIRDGGSNVVVGLESRNDIEGVFNIFENNAEACSLPVEPKPVRVFVGHGGDPQWRDLKDHLHDQHDLDVVAYEIGPRAGLSVKEVLEKMLTESSFALLVLTGEDEQTDGAIHARQNVVHELGLFQGRLGFTRAIALLEEGVEEFSNILGVNQIRFPKDGIRQTFGDVVATVAREFEGA